MHNTYVVQRSSTVAKCDHLDRSLGPLGDVKSRWRRKIWQTKNTLGDVQEAMPEERDVKVWLSDTKTQVDEGDSIVVGLIEGDSTSRERPNGSIGDSFGGVNAST